MINKTMGDRIGTGVIKALLFIIKPIFLMATYFDHRDEWESPAETPATIDTISADHVDRQPKPAHDQIIEMSYRSLKLAAPPLSDLYHTYLRRQLRKNPAEFLNNLTIERHCDLLINMRATYLADQPMDNAPDIVITLLSLACRKPSHRR